MQYSVSSLCHRVLCFTKFAGCNGGEPGPIFEHYKDHMITCHLLISNIALSQQFGFWYIQKSRYDQGFVSTVVIR